LATACAPIICGAAFVFDDDGLTPGLGQFLREGPAGDISDPAWRRGDDQRDLSIGIGRLCRGVAGDARAKDESAEPCLHRSPFIMTD